jgi:hypothetical protein
LFTFTAPAVAAPPARGYSVAEVIIRVTRARAADTETVLGPSTAHAPAG